MIFGSQQVKSIVTALLLVALATQVSCACTGITLKATNGAVVFGRTMEWGPFDLHSRLITVPRGHRFSAILDNQTPGLSWNSKYGVVGVDGVGKDIVVDGMNEKGLQVGLFYHPGVAEYQKYEPAKSGESIAPTDVGTYLLTTCVTVDDVRAAIRRIRVVPVVEEALGIVAAVHFIVTEPSGKAVVIEYLKGEPVIFDAPLGVITNAPSYDWHETNLRNYINLSAVSLPDKKISDLDFKPIGAGSGMIGLPGDFTPPSRFVRAVAFSQSARPTRTGEETMYELYRILDNFNVPVEGAKYSNKQGGDAIRSATQWTTCYDTKNRVMYYHTMNNRRVRRVELDKIDFTNGIELGHAPLDKEPKQDLEDVTPRR